MLRHPQSVCGPLPRAAKHKSSIKWDSSRRYMYNRVLNDCCCQWHAGKFLQAMRGSLAIAEVSKCGDGATQMLISCLWSYKSLKNDQATRRFYFIIILFIYFIFWKPKWKENGLQTAKCIAEGEVWRQDYKMQTIVWLVKPLSAGCVNTVATCWILITSDYIWLCQSSGSEKIDLHTWTRNRKLTLCGLVQRASAVPFNTLIDTCLKQTLLSL